MKKSTLTIFVILGVFLIVMIGTAKLVIDFKTQRFIEEKNIQCQALSNQLNELIANDTESIVGDCMCYYENVKTDLSDSINIESCCICECALVGYTEENCIGVEGWDYFPRDGKCWTRLLVSEYIGAY